MPAHSPIRGLPPDLLNDLGERLSSSGYQNISGHLKWLKGEIARRGMSVRISRTALGDWSKARKEESEVIRGRVAVAAGMASMARDLLPDLESATLLELQINAYENARSLRKFNISALDVEDLSELFKANGALSLNQKRLVETELRRQQLKIANEPKAGKPAKGGAGKKEDGGEKKTRQRISPEVAQLVRDAVEGGGDPS